MPAQDLSPDPQHSKRVSYSGMSVISAKKAEIGEPRALAG